MNHSSIEQLAYEYKNQIIEDRAYIHAHPELGGCEKQTAAYVAQKLRDIGLNPVECVGGYGVTAVIDGNGPGACVGIRADMDALPVHELTGLPFASKKEGISHACGHDAHTAMLLGAARILYRMKDQFPGKVKLIFQPAEENVLLPGAPQMIADGCLENPHVDAMIAQHLYPFYPTGQAASCSGIFLGSSDRFSIKIYGKSCHGAMPQEGTDAVVIAGHVILALQTIISRNIGALDASVITIGTIQGGERYNVVAGDVILEGTCRNLNPVISESMPVRMERIIKGITEALGGRYEFEYYRGYNPLVNDEQLFKIVYRVMAETLGEENALVVKPSMGGEDFSYFSSLVPSVYYWLGCRKPDEPFSDTAPLHNGAFNPQESAMLYGTRIIAGCAIEFLKGR